VVFAGRGLGSSRYGLTVITRGRTERVLVHRWDVASTSTRREPDDLIVEEPMTIQLDGTTVATTMRTPGHDFELAVGFCHTEGLLAGAAVRACRYCGAGPAVDTEFNVVEVDTGGVAPPAVARLGTTSSSCGLCGATAIDELRSRLAPLPATAPWSLEVLASLPARAVDHQTLFGRTGAVHAAAACDRSGDVVVLREDIGRHNAVDKVVGRLLLDGALPATDLALFASGRASFEIVQKAWAAGIGAVVAVSAPSALAVRVAVEAGITLCGFARGGSMNVYHR
jgi:FdhD protein